eukprot:4589601-Prymnesium_polylepis.1
MREYAGGGDRRDHAQAVAGVLGEEKATQRDAEPLGQILATGGNGRSARRYGSSAGLGPCRPRSRRRQRHARPRLRQPVCQ